MEAEQGVASGLGKFASSGVFAPSPAPTEEEKHYRRRCRSTACAVAASHSSPAPLPPPPLSQPTIYSNPLSQPTIATTIAAAPAAATATAGMLPQRALMGDLSGQAGCEEHEKDTWLCQRPLVPPHPQVDAAEGVLAANSLRAHAQVRRHRLRADHSPGSVPPQCRQGLAQRQPRLLPQHVRALLAPSKCPCGRDCLAVHGCRLCDCRHIPQLKYMRVAPSVTMLREPVTRSTSAFLFRGHNPNWDRFNVREEFSNFPLKKPKYSFEDYLGFNEYRNIMTRMFALDSFPYRNLTITDAEFENAKKRLTKFRVIGIQEAFDASARLLLHTFNIDTSLLS